MNFEILFERFSPALKIMWQGMAGIFLVMSVIAVIVFLFTKIAKK